MQPSRRTCNQSFRTRMSGLLLARGKRKEERAKGKEDLVWGWSGTYQSRVDFFLVAFTEVQRMSASWQLVHGLVLLHYSGWENQCQPPASWNLNVHFMFKLNREILKMKESIGN